MVWILNPVISSKLQSLQIKLHHISEPNRYTTIQGVRNGELVGNFGFGQMRQAPLEEWFVGNGEPVVNSFVVVREGPHAGKRYKVVRFDADNLFLQHEDEKWKRKEVLLSVPRGGTVDCI